MMASLWMLYAFLTINNGCTLVLANIIEEQKKLNKNSKYVCVQCSTLSLLWEKIWNIFSIVLEKTLDSFKPQETHTPSQFTSFFFFKYFCFIFCGIFFNNFFSFFFFSFFWDKVILE